MSPNDALIDHMIRELDTLGRNLTKWEVQFLENVTDKWNSERRLSPDEVKKLKEVYEERVR